MGFGRRLRRAVRRVTRVVRRAADVMDPGDWLRAARDYVVDPIINPNQDAMKAQANALKEQANFEKEQAAKAEEERARQEEALREGQKDKFENVGSALGSLMEEEEQVLGTGKKKLGQGRKSAL